MNIQEGDCNLKDWQTPFSRGPLEGSQAYQTQGTWDLRCLAMLFNVMPSGM